MSNIYDEKGFVKTISDDLKSGNFKSTFLQDWEELKEFYLNEENKSEYANMGRFKKGFKITWWLFKKLFYRLSSIRRLLFILGIILIIVGDNNNNNNNLDILGGALLFLIILLELKDKLLAKQELDAGRRVQKSLMPEEAPKVDGWDVWFYYRSANEVSGDLIDYMQTVENRTDLILADVSGKGLAAALLTSKLQSTIRALSEEYNTADKLFEKVNTIFFRDSASNTFASLFYLQLEKNSEYITYLNAGHIPPLHVSSNGVTQLEKGDIAIGLSGKSKYQEKKIELDKDDSLIIFSDGVTETSDSMGTFFGTERLINQAAALKNLSSKEAGQFLIKNIEEFRGEAKVHDDLSIIIVNKK